MKIYPICITSTSTAYATVDTTTIHHIYNLILQSAFLFSTTGSWDLFVIKSVAVFGLVFFQANDVLPITRLYALYRELKYRGVTLAAPC